MARRVDNGDVILGRLELPKRNVDCDAALALLLELVEHPRVFERAFSHLNEKETSVS